MTIDSTRALESTQQQVLAQLQAGSTQYIDGSAAPAHPIGNQIIYNNAGTETAVSTTSPLPSSITLSGTAVKDDTQFGDGVTSGILSGTARLWNGASYDRLRGNIDTYQLLASGAISANANGSDQLNYNARGVKLFINTGAFGSGSSAITVTLQGKDPVSGQYYTILASASLTAGTFLVLSAYPGLTASANVTANDVLPRTFRITYQASNWGTGGSVLGIACAMII